MKDFDRLWRFEAVKLAVIEQLDRTGDLNFKKLFSRAKQIYNEGLKNRIQDWDSIWLDDGKELDKKKVVVNVKEKKGYKKCPECGEQVLISWKKHTFKKNGDKCGHEFKK